MTATLFRTKWMLGILVLVSAFVASQLMYRSSIIRLHDHLLTAARITEQMHASEKFHSAIHLMLIAAAGYAETGNESMRSEYVRKLDAARTSLSTLEAQDHRQTPPAPGQTGLKADFERYSRVLDGVVDASPGDSDTPAALALARELFDSTFSHFYSELHQRHAADLGQATQSAHRIQFWTDALFFAQLGLAVLFGLLGLLYLERIVRAFLAEAEHLAITDGLTGVFNRRYLDTALEEELSRSRRYGRSMTIAMIDIDHFKRFNDTQGHQAGDQILRALTKVMRQNTRAEDRIARYGGEEFAVILPETALDEGMAAAEKLRRSVEQYFDSAGQATPVTVSIGVASAPGDGTTAAEMLRTADERLYRAKAAGRNCVVPSVAADTAAGFVGQQQG